MKDKGKNGGTKRKRMIRCEVQREGVGGREGARERGRDRLNNRMAVCHTLSISAHKRL